MAATRFNPFPGLRSFEPDEDHLFFGRETQITELVSRLRRARFLGVIGASGSGKSSLVKSGLIPSLHSGFMAHAGSSWRIALMRPGSDPIGNLAAALDAPGVLRNAGDGPEGPDPMRLAMLDASLRRNARGLVDVVRQARIPAHENVLIVADQFEELFRFKAAKANLNARDESVAFVKLLLEAAQQEDVRIFVILTMRSEFIGQCTEFPGLADTVNQGQYLIPRMTRDELRLAITGPVAVGGGTIAPRLVTRVLNDVGDDPDQLPVLQHALMRTWDHWAQHRAGSDPIDLVDYERIGTMKDALSRHAEEAFAELTTPRAREIAERVFEALTEMSPQAGGLRRPCRLSELCEVTGATPAEVVAVVDRFRLPGRSFLMPPLAVSLRDDSIVDLSHESLMRLWTRLITWTHEEARSAEIYRRLSQAARLKEQGEAGLWRDPELQLAVNWRDTAQPTAAWARRYDADFDRALAFLRESQQSRDAEVADKERRRRAELVRTRRAAMALGSLCVLALAAGGFAVSQCNTARVAETVARAETLRATSAEQAAKRSEVAALAAEDKATEEATKARTAEELEKRAAAAALASAQLATTEAAKAVAAEKEALKEREIARTSELAAQTAAAAALAARNQAELAQQAAEAAGKKEKEARDDADRLGRLQLSRALAAKAAGPWSATEQKVAAMLAHEAYVLAKANGGDPQSPDIYRALQSTLDAMAPDRRPMFRGHGDAVRALALGSRDGRLATGSDDGAVRLFDSRTSGAPLSILAGPRDAAVRSLAFNQTGSRLTAGYADGSIRIWNLDRANTVPQLLVAGPDGSRAHGAAVSGLAFTAQGQLVSAGLDGRILVWDRLEDAPRATVLASRPHAVLSIAINPQNGNMLAAGTDGDGLLIWNLRDTAASPRVLAKDGRVSAVAFSRDDRFLVSGAGDGKLTRWEVGPMSGDLGSAAPVKSTVIAAHTASVTSLAYGRTLLASSSLDGTVKMWRINDDPSLERPTVVGDHLEWLWAVALNPDEDRVFAGGVDRMARSWQTDTAPLADEVCRRVPSGLTADQWTKYVSTDLPYQPGCSDGTTATPQGIKR